MIPGQKKWEDEQYDKIRHGWRPRAKDRWIEEYNKAHDMEPIEYKRRNAGIRAANRWLLKTANEHGGSKTVNPPSYQG